jgi:hypothetical protein
LGQLGVVGGDRQVGLRERHRDVVERHLEQWGGGGELGEFVPAFLVVAGPRVDRGTHPYQAGRWMRHWVQANTHGIARRSLDAATRLPPRRPGREVELADRVERGRLVQVVDQLRRVVHQLPVGVPGELGELAEHLVDPFGGWRAPVGDGGEQDGVDDLFEVAVGQGGSR